MESPKNTSGTTNTGTSNSDTQSRARTLQIDGMTGDLCVQKVTEALRSVPNVTTKSVSVGSATIEADKAGCDAACAAINKAGYKSTPQAGAAASSDKGANFQKGTDQYANQQGNKGAAQAEGPNGMPASSQPKGANQGSSSNQGSSTQGHAEPKLGNQPAATPSTAGSGANR